MRWTQPSTALVFQKKVKLVPWDLTIRKKRVSLVPAVLSPKVSSMFPPLVAKRVSFMPNS